MIDFDICDIRKGGKKIGNGGCFLGTSWGWEKTKLKKKKQKGMTNRYLLQDHARTTLSLLVTLINSFICPFI
jgi:hypothetical protein